MFDFFKKKRKATLVLGGGSARGIAHVGVLKVLEREGVAVERIVGTSMGALVGAAYCMGHSIAELEDAVNKFTVNKLLDPTMPSMGLLAGDKMEAIIKDLVGDKSFEECKIPFVAVTTDIETGEEVIYHRGAMTKVVRASCSWPGIFNPVRIDGRLLSDGGIKNSVPTRIAKSFGADYIIAVDVGFCVRRGRIDNIFQMILQSFQIMGEELNMYQANEADVVIKVNLGDIDQTAFNRGREAMIKGLEAADSKIGLIKKDLRIK